MPYYVLDENNNRQEAYSKEEILSVLAQAIQDGTLANISKDAGFISKIKCACTGTTIKEAFITQAQYNALATAGTLEPNTLYNIIDDTTCEDIDKAMEEINTNITDIEKRLDALGFNEGAFIVSDISTDYIITNSLKKQGKYVIANLNILTRHTGIYIDASKITIPSEFRPKENVNINVRALYVNSGIGETINDATINTDGTITITSKDYEQLKINNVGWELP